MLYEFEKNCSNEQIQEVISILNNENIENYKVNYNGSFIIVCKKGICVPMYVKSKEIKTPYMLVSRAFKKSDTIVNVDGVEFGGEKKIIIAGPCSVENEESLLKTAEYLNTLNVDVLRGGAFKPRTSPYSFRGLGEEGLKILSKAKDKTKLKVITEVMTPSDVELVSNYADILQIGSRNMQNFQLLDKVGESKKPVLLKRGMSAKVEEWLLSAEYILSKGNPNVILCERGIRTFETALRNTLDLSVVPLLKELTHLPVIVDPSHGTGKRSLINPMSKASIAAGADGLMIEVHPDPENALSDGDQSLTFEQFEILMKEVQQLERILKALK